MINYSICGTQRCMYCKNGVLKDECITRTYEKNGVVTVITGVPVRACDTCRQEFLDDETVRQLENIRKKGRGPGISMAVFHYSVPIGSDAVREYRGKML